MSEVFERVIGFADTYGTRATVRYDPPDGDDDESAISVSIELGFCGGRAFPSPETARQLAAALLDAADRYDDANPASAP